MQVTYIFILVFAVIIAMFAVLNGTPVDVNLLFTKIPDVSLAVVILGSATIGAVLGYSFDLLKRIKSSMRIKELEKKNTALTAELETLKKDTDNDESEITMQEKVTELKK